MIRSLASCMLVVWLLAVGVGVAQACGIGASVSASDHRPDGATTTAGHRSAQAAGQAGAPADEGCTGACEKFCDEAKAVSKLTPSTPDLPSPELPAPVLALRLHDEPLVAAEAAAGGHAPIDRPRLPIPIAYLRLAL